MFLCKNLKLKKGILTDQTLNIMDQKKRTGSQMDNSNPMISNQSKFSDQDLIKSDFLQLVEDIAKSPQKASEAVSNLYSLENTACLLRGRVEDLMDKKN